MPPWDEFITSGLIIALHEALADHLTDIKIPIDQDVPHFIEQTIGAFYDIAVLCSERHVHSSIFFGQVPYTTQLSS